MEFFRKFFKGEWIEYDTGELAVKCPFPHTDEKGQQYYESVPSAHINQSKSLFHCKVCGKGMSEAVFLSKLQGISYRDALVLLKTMENNHGGWIEERQHFLNSEAAQETWAGLGLNMDTADKLKIGYEGEGISFPVFIYGELLDIRNYKPGRNPKVMSKRGAKKLLLPFDVWREDDRPTFLCAGEKDMATMRQLGFNSLTFTGGEQSFPKLFKHSFKGKIVFICYDNDQAGHDGARKVASYLKDAGAIPYIVTGHHLVCTEKGGDIHDYFIKHGKSVEDFESILESTPAFTEEEHMQEKQKYIPLVSIEEATQGRYANRLVSSRVQVVATYEEIYHVPEYVDFKKMQDDGGTMELDEEVTYLLDESNCEDILYLMDSNLKEQQIKENLKMVAGIFPKEKYVGTQEKSRVNVFKTVVMDDLETGVTDEDRKSMRELLVYSIGEKLQSGQKYRITYKPVAHPLRGQQVVGIVTELKESDNAITQFRITPQVKESLKCFQVDPGQKLTDKMNELFERSKGIIGVEARKDVTFATELFFHTPLQFKFGRRTERAYLDAMMVGDPRTGKSQAAKKLLELYGLGLITSLKTATTAGLLGGSDQTAGGWKTKLGLIPRNHKGALVLEEFSGGGQELVSKLTEVRSSNRVRLTRVNGSIDVPAQVRMLSISNPSTGQGGTSLPLRNYPNGIQVLLDLIGASEDIARYDFFLLVDKPDKYTSPLEDFEQEPFPEENYKNRVRWVWSRTADQIILDEEVQQHIVNLAEGLNEKYDCHIALFGAEAWKKLARIAIAAAGMVCSTDETGENLVVTKEHVTWARNFFLAIYDNKVFKLREFVENYRKANEADESAVAALQGIYNTHAIMLKQLEMSTEMHHRDLQMMSGLDSKEFSKVLNQLVRFNFVSYGAKVTPTQRFRTAMSSVDTQTYMPKVGEN